MKLSYWSCSRFADWIRGTPKPCAGTAEEWNVWEKQARAKKVRYWLAEEAFDYIQSFFCWPLERIDDVRYYINNRWISKTHQLTSHLKRGQWHEFDSRMLHCLFDELVDFVEIEQAWSYVSFSDNEYLNYKNFFHRVLSNIGLWRCPEAGLSYLHWAAELKNNEEWMNKDDPSFEQPTAQALIAQETLLLYNWWKNRPKRLDPMDASGWTTYCEESRKAAKKRGDDSSLFLFDTNESDESQEQSRKILAICHKMEQEQEDEDTEMLIRLVKIRKGLWT